MVCVISIEHEMSYETEYAQIDAAIWVSIIIHIYIEPGYFVIIDL